MGKWKDRALPINKQIFKKPESLLYFFVEYLATLLQVKKKKAIHHSHFQINSDLNNISKTNDMLKATT